MNFGEILHVAQKNAKSVHSSENKKFYPSKFDAPKKETKEKKLSDNIRRFLAQKAEEEEHAKLQKLRKCNDLMAARSSSEKNKIRKHLKITKSANKSVLDDVDTSQNAVTLQDPEQPDEDDYGYVSQEVSSIHQSLVSKFRSIPEENKFSKSSKVYHNRNELNSTKNRVLSAIKNERDGERTAQKRPSTAEPAPSSNGHGGEHHRRSRKNLYDPNAEREEEERRRRAEEEQKRKERKKKAPPPALDFQNLMKLAEQKQFEPIEIEVPVKPKEPERLLTNKEKRQIEEKKIYFAEKGKRKPEQTNPAKSKAEAPKECGKIGRIPKVGSAAADRPSSQNSKIPKTTTPSQPSKNLTARPSTNITSVKPNNPQPPKISSSHVSPRPSNLNPSKDVRNTTVRPKGAPHPVPSRCSHSSTQSMAQKAIKVAKTRDIAPKEIGRSKDAPKIAEKCREFPPKDVAKTRDFPPRDVVRTREFPPRDVVKTREFPPRDVVKTREFPPRDVVRTREFPPRDVHRNGNGPKRKIEQSKRRILDEEDESEYDSEMDDFIDDDDDNNDYSKHIKDIFGYDKSRYRYMDADDSDEMESSFAQQQREEFISKKIGLMEDLEDMRKESEEKARKHKRRRL